MRQEKIKDWPSNGWVHQDKLYKSRVHDSFYFCLSTAIQLQLKVQSKDNELEEKVNNSRKTKEDYFKSQHLLIKASLEQSNQLLIESYTLTAKRLSLLAATGLACRILTGKTVIRLFIYQDEIKNGICCCKKDCIFSSEHSFANY